MHPPQPLPRLSKGRAQLWASCLDGAYRDRTAFINRTRPWERVSWSRSHGDIPSTGPPPGLRRGRFAQRRALSGRGSSGPGDTPALTARPLASTAAQAKMPNLRTWPPEAGHLGHSHGSPEKTLLGPGTANPLPSFGVSAPRAFQNRTRRLREPIGGGTGARGVSRLDPFSPKASKSECEEAPGPISGGAAEGGVSSLAFSLRPSQPSRRARRCPLH